jgi:hypothetical protein
MRMVCVCFFGLVLFGHCTVSLEEYHCEDDSCRSPSYEVTLPLNVTPSSGISVSIATDNDFKVGFHISYMSAGSSAPVTVSVKPRSLAGKGYFFLAWIVRVPVVSNQTSVFDHVRLLYDRELHANKVTMCI